MAIPPPKKTPPKHKPPPKGKAVSSQRYLDIAQIRDGVMVMRDGSLRVVILVNAINFALKSDDEQNAIIYAYQGFLNSFSFPIQIIMQSRQLDLANYIKKLEDRLAETTNELVQIQITDYIEFIGRLIQIANIMDKKFYVVIPFRPPVTYQRGIIDKLFKPSNRLEVKMSPAEFKSYRQELLERAKIIMSGLGGMGLRTALLGTQETIELLYNTYNPEEATKERLAEFETITGAYVHPPKTAGKNPESGIPASPAGGQNPESTSAQTGEAAQPIATNPLANVAPTASEPAAPVEAAVTPVPVETAPVAQTPTIPPAPTVSVASQPVSVPVTQQAAPTPIAPEAQIPANTPTANPETVAPIPHSPSPITPPNAPATNPNSGFQIPDSVSKPAVPPTETLTSLPGTLPTTAGPIQGEPQQLGAAPATSEQPVVKSEPAPAPAVAPVSTPTTPTSGFGLAGGTTSPATPPPVLPGK